MLTMLVASIAHRKETKNQVTFMRSLSSEVTSLSLCEPSGCFQIGVRGHGVVFQNVQAGQFNCLSTEGDSGETHRWCPLRRTEDDWPRMVVASSVQLPVADCRWL